MSFPQASDALPLYESIPVRLNPGMILPPKRSARPETGADAGAAAYSPAVTFEDLLIATGQNANRDAFVRLFEHFAPRVKSFLMRGGTSADIADELAQETMLSVWDKARQYDPAKAAASTWIFTIARNKRADYLRKAARPEPDPHDPLAVYDIAPAAPDQYMQQAQDKDRIHQALATLPAEQAEILYKSFFEEKTHAAIAKETALPLGTVKSRLRLALARLRAVLAPPETGDQDRAKERRL